jgi:hypothetical protein
MKNAVEGVCLLVIVATSTARGVIRDDLKDCSQREDTVAS